MEFTRFQFENKVFAIPGAYIFGSGSEREPMLKVRIGDLDVALPIEGVCTEFSIAPDTPDWRLLRLAAKSLAYVRSISPGDSIPNEILDGSSSWRVEDRHIELARNRFLLALAGSALDPGKDAGGPKEIAAQLEQPEVKGSLQQAFDAAASQLELPGRDDVLVLVEQIAREHAYVVALREYYDWVLALPDALKRTHALLKQDRQTLETAMRVHQIASDTVTRYRKQFDGLDARLNKANAVLLNLSRTVTLIRSVRDALHRDTLIWGEIEEDWRTPALFEAKHVRKLLLDLYPFLARNFLSD